VQADYAVELGPDDDVLELPWAAPDHGLQYYDLKRYPELLHHIPEAQRVPELGDFLAAVNSRTSTLETAKCDVWCSREMNAEEEIFMAAVKFGSYVDLLFSDEPRRFSLPDHQNFLSSLVNLLTRTPEIPAASEFLIRRCYYRSAKDHTEQGFYITFYLFGYDADEDLARQRWRIGLKLAQNALLQLSLREY
jgi:hypothetical protein